MGEQEKDPYQIEESDDEDVKIVPPGAQERALSDQRIRKKERKRRESSTTSRAKRSSVVNRTWNSGNDGPIHAPAPGNVRVTRGTRNVIEIDGDAKEEAEKLKEKIANRPPVPQDDEPSDKSDVCRMKEDLEKRRRSSIKGYLPKDGHTVSSKEARRKAVAGDKKEKSEDDEISIVEVVESSTTSVTVVQSKEMANSPPPDLSKTFTVRRASASDSPEAPGSGHVGEIFVNGASNEPACAATSDSPSKPMDLGIPYMSDDSLAGYESASDDLEQSPKKARDQPSTDHLQEDENNSLSDSRETVKLETDVNVILRTPEHVKMEVEDNQPSGVGEPNLEPEDDITGPESVEDSGLPKTLLDVFQPTATGPEEIAPGVVAGQEESSSQSPVKADVDGLLKRNDEKANDLFLEAFEGNYEILPNLDRPRAESDFIYVQVKTMREGEVPKPWPPTPQDSKLGYGTQDIVKLPWSTSNVTRDGDRSFIVIKEGLRSIVDSLESIDSLPYCLEEYSRHWDFSALGQFYENLETRDERMNLLLTLQGIAQLALRAEELITKPLHYLPANSNTSVTLSQEQCASLLANAFYCTFDTIPHRKECNYFSMASFMTLNNRMALVKLKFIIHYFETILAKMPTGCVTFRRKSMRMEKIPDWSNETSVKMPDLAVIDNPIEECYKCLQMDFANKFIGGGVMNTGAVQEEIRFLLCPEMIVSLLLCPMLKDREALVISGAQRYSSYTGYSSGLEWRPFDANDDMCCQTDKFGRLDTELLALDALQFSRTPEQYTRLKINRELAKAFVGFHSSQSVKRPIATGNWGCGAFGGDLHLKSLIQLMAAGVCGRSLLYNPYDQKKFKNELLRVYYALKENEVSVGQLYRIVMSYSYRPTLSLFTHVMHCLKNGLPQQSAFNPPLRRRAAVAAANVDYGGMEE